MTGKAAHRTHVQPTAARVRWPTATIRASRTSRKSSDYIQKLYDNCRHRRCDWTIIRCFWLTFRSSATLLLYGHSRLRPAWTFLAHVRHDVLSIV